MASDNIIKINLEKVDEDKKWNLFAEKCFNATINRNEELVVKGSKFAYTFTYAPDEVTLTNHEIINDIPFELKSITLSQEEYEQSNKLDKDIIESLFNTIQKTN